MKFDSGKYDRRHAKDIKRIQLAVKAILDDAIARGVMIAEGTQFDGTLAKMFDFDDFPLAKRLMEELIQEMHSNIYHTIIEGNKSAIDLSNLKNDTMVLSAVAGGTDKINELAVEIKAGVEKYRIPKEWLDHNLLKVEVFNNRVKDGMNLSDRVWNITDSFYEDLTMALDEGFHSGKSAAELSREVRGLLKEPNNLYRRVRNRHGRLVPSKRMRRKKTGSGVYKSSYKNALRLAGTETNIAYRTNDHERWNALPFVEGIEIHTSHTNHPVRDICDELAGTYPKSFKFVGWHPNCRCYAVAKLPSVEDYEKYREAIMEGTEDDFEFDEVTELPENFTNWLDANQEKINNAKSVPYFIQDNFKDKNKLFNDKSVWKDRQKLERLYNQIRLDKNYYNVEFDKKKCCLRATHIGHNFDKTGGEYEKHVQNAGYKSGHSVILGDERGLDSRHTEGLWDGMPFEVAGRETATENNVVKGLKHGAEKRITKIAVLDYPKGGFNRDILNNAIKRYKGLEKLKDSQFVKFDKVICVQSEEIVAEIDF